MQNLKNVSRDLTNTYQKQRLDHFPFQTIQFSISTQFKCKYSLIVKNISISGYSVVSNSSNSINSV